LFSLSNPCFLGIILEIPSAAVIKSQQHGIMNEVPQVTPMKAWHEPVSSGAVEFFTSFRNRCP